VDQYQSTGSRLESASTNTAVEIDLLVNSSVKIAEVGADQGPKRVASGVVYKGYVCFQKHGFNGRNAVDLMHNGMIAEISLATKGLEVEDDACVIPFSQIFKGKAPKASLSAGIESWAVGCSAMMYDPWEGKVTATPLSELQHGASTKPGSSGQPLLVNGRIVGLHQRGDQQRGDQHLNNGYQPIAVYDALIERRNNSKK